MHHFLRNVLLTNMRLLWFQNIYNTNDLVIKMLSIAYHQK